MNGERLRWMRHHSVPKTASLLALLSDFPEAGALDDLHPS
jgi:hypothetical protein